MIGPGGLTQAIDRYKRVAGLDGYRRSNRRFPNPGDMRRKNMQMIERRKPQGLVRLMIEQRGQARARTGGSARRY